MRSGNFWLVMTALQDPTTGAGPTPNATSAPMPATRFPPAGSIRIHCSSWVKFDPLPNIAQKGAGSSAAMAALKNPK
jgi:hypothetical protein